MPLTSTPSLPASPLIVSEPSPLFHTSVSLPAPPFIMSAPFAPTRRSLPSPPFSESLLSAPVRTSSPPSPLSFAAAISVFFASTVSESLPSPPLTTTVNVPSAGTVWSPSVALSQSEPLLSPPVVWPCTSRPPDTDTVTLSSAPSRLSVAVVPLIDAELTAASAGTAVAAKLAASAVTSAARIVVRFMSSPSDRVAITIEDPGRLGFLPDVRRAAPYIASYAVSPGAGDTRPELGARIRPVLNSGEARGKPGLASGEVLLVVMPSPAGPGAGDERRR